MYWQSIKYLTDVSFVNRINANVNTTQVILKKGMYIVTRIFFLVYRSCFWNRTIKKTICEFDPNSCVVTNNRQVWIHYFLLFQI